MFKNKNQIDWSLCPYTKLWCYGRKVGDMDKCQLCDVAIKYRKEISMKIIAGIEIDKEIREGWTYRDFMNEIDDMIFDCFMGRLIYKTPKNKSELSKVIENLIPKHMFTTHTQFQSVVRDLTKIYAEKYGLEE